MTRNAACNPPSPENMAGAYCRFEMRQTRTTQTSRIDAVQQLVHGFGGFRRAFSTANGERPPKLRFASCNQCIAFTRPSRASVACATISALRAAPGEVVLVAGGLRLRMSIS
jgi:hypothetical protein